MSSANGPSHSPPEVRPATLPGTPVSFPISTEELIRRARYIVEKAGIGAEDPSVLADNFRFEFPVVSLDKKKYLESIKTFQIKAAFPNFETHPYHFRVDPYENQRVWFTTRGTGTHTGTLNFFGLKIKPTHKEYHAAPEINSLVFNEEGQVVTYTGGYIADKHVGNTKGYGALFGILSSIGVPAPGTARFFIYFFAAKTFNIAFGVTNFFTLGLLGKAFKTD